jgi:hypothetical protein
MLPQYTSVVVTCPHILLLQARPPHALHLLTQHLGLNPVPLKPLHRLQHLLRPNKYPIRIKRTNRKQRNSPSRQNPRQPSQQSRHP